jgi:ribokinase
VCVCVCVCVCEYAQWFPSPHQAALTRARQTAAIAATMLRLRGCQTVVITLGAQGAIVHDGAWTHIPTAAVRAVDTSGAGDAFIGALAHYMAAHPHMPLREMVAKACAISTRSVLKEGTQSSYPAAADLPADLL